MQGNIRSIKSKPQEVNMSDIDDLCREWQLEALELRARGFNALDLADYYETINPRYHNDFEEDADMYFRSSEERYRWCAMLRATKPSPPPQLEGERYFLLRSEGLGPVRPEITSVISYVGTVETRPMQELLQTNDPHRFLADYYGANRGSAQTRASITRGKLGWPLGLRWGNPAGLPPDSNQDLSPLDPYRAKGKLDWSLGLRLGKPAGLPRDSSQDLSPLDPYRAKGKLDWPLGLRWGKPAGLPLDSNPDSSWPDLYRGKGILDWSPGLGWGKAVEPPSDSSQDLSPIDYYRAKGKLDWSLGIDWRESECMQPSPHSGFKFTHSWGW